ncbi:gamma-glutamyl-gamma-aminobutyrate hydrolase family protein [Amycolatopsis sacchari]|uniref:gamma-glutamyl-gamma-aminobutyrate hydrolase family protein n=1 Tax=Amycolatopsis sacchari TaxID=115433 RepID=UPI003EB75913
MSGDGAAPVVAVSGCTRPGGADGGSMYRVDDKYVLAAAEELGALPLMVPPIGGLLAAERLLEVSDGLLLTGSLSDIDPAVWHGGTLAEGATGDPGRDGTIIPLIPRALRAGVPVLAICRGLHEVNVAFGGTIGEIADKARHRRYADVPESAELRPEAFYGAIHPIRVQPGGLLADLADGADEVWVNSYHRQVVDRLADGLTVEAVSPDGCVEALSRTVDAAPCLAVQWHPEHRIAREWPLSKALFRWFADQVRQRVR